MPAKKSHTPVRRRAPAATDALPAAQFGRGAAGVFEGHVRDPARPQQRFTVDLLIDGLVAASQHADRFVAALAHLGIGDGCYGFSFALEDAVVAGARQVEARIANTEIIVGLPIALQAVGTAAPALQTAELRWIGGLRFEGWLAAGEAGAVEIWVDEARVLQVQPTGWTHTDAGRDGRPARRLDIHLPQRFADGRVHRLSAQLDGRSLTATPLVFVAFDNGLEATLQALGRWDSEKLRGRLFDQLVPASLPFSAYAAWKARFPPVVEAQGGASLTAAVMLVGDGRVEETIDSLEAQTHPAWSAVALPGQGGVTRFAPAPALAHLAGEGHDGDFVVFCLAGTVLAETALQRLADAFAGEPACQCVYGDIDMLGADHSVWPLALPAYDAERMREQGYGAHVFAVRRAAVLACLPAAATLYGLFASVADYAGAAAIWHLPGALAAVPRFDVAAASLELAEATSAHLARANRAATVALPSPRPGAARLLPAVRVQRAWDRSARTAVVIPTRNRASLLSKCIASILPAVERCGGHIVIVDNDSQEPETLDYLAQIASARVSVIPVPGPFNFARINNVAIAQLEADHICLLNNDVEAVDDAWLSELLSRLADPDVGAVGARLVWPSGVVQHGGVVLGPSFAAAHAFNDRMDGDPGYAGMLEVARECSAVTAACLLMRRSDYLAVGGMDEIRFPVNFNDVDLCLKLRQRGRRIVFTPHAKLLHLESASRGRDEAPDRQARFARELRMLRAVWGQALLDDPYYSPMLSLDPTPFSALAWPPRAFAVRANAPPQACAVPPGL